MAAIVATSVTYTLIGKQTKDESGKKRNLATVAFGDGALTYPTGGVPLDPGKLGVPTQLSQFNIVDSHGDGNVYKFDRTAGKLMIFESAVGGGALTEIAASAAPTVSIIVEAVGY